jgi:ribosomal protein S18 acetylase RimI-like enzyme
MTSNHRHNGECSRMTVEISKATKKDLRRLIEMFSDPDLKTNIDESDWFVRCYFDYHQINVARVKGEIQGACFWRIEGERYSGLGWIENLWVEAQYRGMNLGEMLLRRSIEDMKAFFEKDNKKLRRVVLTTQVERDRARRLYEKVGFRSVASLGDIYDPGGNDLFYVLDVQD